MALSGRLETMLAAQGNTLFIASLCWSWTLVLGANVVPSAAEWFLNV